MRVWLDPDKLKSYGLTVLDVQNAIQNQNIQVAAGQIGGPPAPSNQVFQFTVNTLGPSVRCGTIRGHHRQKPTTSQRDQLKLRKTTETNQTAAIVRIQDVARVELSQQSTRSFPVSAERRRHTSPSLPSRARMPFRWRPRPAV